jgi:PAS domain S-box-containing protein
MNKVEKNQSIRDHELLLSELTNMVPGVVFQLYVRQNGDMGFYYMSPKSEQVIGLKPELEGYLERFTRLLIPEHRDDFLQSIDKSVKESAEWKYEGMLQKPSGERIWFSCNSTPSPREDQIVFNGILLDITLRKKTEMSLKESEEKFRCIVECSPIAKYLYRLESDDRLILIGANPSADRIIGISHHDLLGKTIEEAFPQLVPTDIPSMYRKIARGQSGNQSFEIPYKDNRFSGYYEVTVFQAGANQIVVNFIDISERKRAAQELRESEEKYRLLHENAGIGIGYYKPDGTVLSFNRLAASHMNGTPEDFIGKSIYTLFSKQDAEFYHARIKKACLDDKPMVYEDSVPLPSGNKHFLSIFVKITNAENDILGIQVISQDITEIKRTEFKLSESESKFRSVFEQSPVGSVFVGLDTRFIKCNQAFCTFLGYDENELIGKPIADITYPEDLQAGMKEMKLIAEGKLDSFTLEKRYVRKNGEVVWGEVSISMVRDPMGNPLYFLPIIKDISDRKKAEEEHLNYEQQLQLNQRLESLGILAGGIAHDFNNLMGGIFGYIDLASGCSKDPNVAAYLDKALATINRARGLTQQLLTFAKGGAPIQKVGSLFPCVREAAEFALSGSNVSCRFDIPANIWHCNFDKNQISQVIDNIVINAQHAMPAGGTIRLVAQNIVIKNNGHPKLAEGNYSRISIIDQGIGIPKELLSRIFDPFFTTKSKGHGLGLATCYSIINRHGGAIDVESEPGKGSTFHIYLPAAEKSASVDTVQTKVLHRGEGIIIVMDDEEVIRDTVGDMLKVFGYSPKCVDCGREALELLDKETKAKHTVIAMILDLTVAGGMGGKDAIVEIRKVNPQIPVFVASGYADDPVMQNPTEYGFTASISKPFTRNVLADMLSNYLTDT